nr:hypothetical protein [Microctonus hyperodae filamentous virus]
MSKIVIGIQIVNQSASGGRPRRHFFSTVGREMFLHHFTIKDDALAKKAIKAKMLLTYLIVCCCGVIFVSSAAAEDGKERVQYLVDHVSFKGRPTNIFPLPETTTSNTPTLAIHHIVSRADLEIFVTGMFRNREYRTTMRQMMQDLISHLPENVKLNLDFYDRFMNPEIPDSVLLIPDDDEENNNMYRRCVEEIQELFRLFYHLPYNIFIGPEGSVRSRDMGAGFDHEGATLYQTRYGNDAIVRFYAAVRVFNNRQTSDANRREALASAYNYHRQMLQQSELPMQYDADDWKEVYQLDIYKEIMKEYYRVLNMQNKLNKAPAKTQLRKFCENIIQTNRKNHRRSQAEQSFYQLLIDVIQKMMIHDPTLLSEAMYELIENGNLNQFFAKFKELLQSWPEILALMNSTERKKFYQLTDEKTKILLANSKKWLEEYKETVCPTTTASTTTCKPTKQDYFNILPKLADTLICTFLDKDVPTTTMIPTYDELRPYERKRDEDDDDDDDGDNLYDKINKFLRALFYSQFDNVMEHGASGIILLIDIVNITESQQQQQQCKSQFFDNGRNIMLLRRSKRWDYVDVKNHDFCIVRNEFEIKLCPYINNYNQIVAYMITSFRRQEQGFYLWNVHLQAFKYEKQLDDDIYRILESYKVNKLEGVPQENLTCLIQQQQQRYTSSTTTTTHAPPPPPPSSSPRPNCPGYRYAGCFADQPFREKVSIVLEKTACHTMNILSFGIGYFFRKC